MGTSKPPSFLVHSNKNELKNEHVKNAVIETAFTILFFIDLDLGLGLDLKEREKNRYCGHANVYKCLYLK